MEYITIDFGGGLGNQLFKLACMLTYAKQYNKKILLNKPTESISCFKPRPVYWKTLFKNIETFYQENISFTNIERISPHNYIKIPFIENNVFIKGYVQNVKYFNEEKDYVLNTLFPEEYKIEAKKIIHNFPKDLIFAHFRRGDYKRLPEVFPILDKKYYNFGISNFNTNNVLILCEEEDKENIINEQLFLDKNIIFLSNDIPDYIQLLIMSHIPNGGIIANSTFSWWGAFVGNYNFPTAKYVSPSKWFVFQKEPVSEIVLPNWIIFNN